MKDLIQQARDTYAAFTKASADFDKARKALENQLKTYAIAKSKEFSKLHNLEGYHRHDDMFVINLDGGSATGNWKIDGGFFSNFSRNYGGEFVWYEPTDRNTWLRVLMPNFQGKIGQEIPGDQGPVAISALKALTKEMTKESGARFYLYERKIKDEFLTREFQQIKYLDGTIYTAPEKEEDDGCDCD